MVHQQQQVNVNKCLVTQIRQLKVLYGVKERVCVCVSCEILFLVTNKNFLQFQCRILDFYDIKLLLESGDFLFKFHDTLADKLLIDFRILLSNGMVHLKPV